MSKYIVVSKDDLEVVMAGGEAIVQIGEKTSKKLTMVTDEERKLAKLEARYNAQRSKILGNVS